MHGTGVRSSHAHWPILVWVIQAFKGFLILCWNTQAISKKIIMAYCHWSVSGPNFLLVVVLFRVTHLPTSSKNWIARMTSRLFLVILADLFFKQLRRSNWKEGLITLQSIFQKVWPFISIVNETSLHPSTFISIIFMVTCFFDHEGRSLSHGH